MTEKSEFFDKVEALRKHMFLTTSEMAELIGVSRMAYYNWTRGKTSPSPTNREIVRVVVKKLLRVMQEFDWPTGEIVAMSPLERKLRLQRLLDNV